MIEKVMTSFPNDALKIKQKRVENESIVNISLHALF